MNGTDVINAAMRLYGGSRGPHGPSKGPLHRLALVLDVGSSTVQKWARGKHPVPTWAAREITRLLASREATTEPQPCPAAPSSSPVAPSSSS